MKKNLFNWMAILVVAIVSFFAASCNKSEPSASDQSSEIVDNLMKYKWVAIITDYDTYSYGASTYTQILTVYFTSDHEGVLNVLIKDYDSSLGTKTREQHIDFTYSVDGKKVRLSGGSSFCFDYYGNYMLEGTDMFKASEMTSSDYTYLRDHKAGYHGTDGPINTTIHTLDESEIFYHVTDAGNGWYEYYLKFGFYPEDDAQKKGITRIKITMWVENGCLDDSKNTSNYGKEETSTLNLDLAEKEWFELFRVFSKEDKIYFNYKLEYYNSYNEKWYECARKRLTFSRDGNDADGNMGEHDYVDLGLPSGTLWATTNVGASKPEEYGDYFAWGETIGYNGGKTSFNWNTYKYCRGAVDTMTKYCTKSAYGTVDNKTVLESADDAATVRWGAGWQMPSHDQFEELTNSSYTKTEWTTVNGVNGIKITSKSNLISVFLPAAGKRSDTYHEDIDPYGCYWSRSLRTSSTYGGCCLFFNPSMVVADSWGDRYVGHSVRPVRVQK